VVVVVVVVLDPMPPIRCLLGHFPDATNIKRRFERGKIRFCYFFTKLFNLNGVWEKEKGMIEGPISQSQDYTGLIISRTTQAVRHEALFMWGGESSKTTGQTRQPTGRQVSQKRVGRPS
jgi:hypothetical protein